jgi:hypothetical protein
VEESGLGLLEVLSRNIPGETKKNDQCCVKARAELMSRERRAYRQYMHQSSAIETVVSVENNRT